LIQQKKLSLGTGTYRLAAAPTLSKSRSFIGITFKLNARFGKIGDGRNAFFNQLVVMMLWYFIHMFCKSKIGYCPNINT
jgi:hypothetical protein